MGQCWTGISVSAFIPAVSSNGSWAAESVPLWHLQQPQEFFSEIFVQEKLGFLAVLQKRIQDGVDV